MSYPQVLASQVIPGDTIIVTGRPATVTLTVDDGPVLRIYTAGDDGDYVQVRPSWPLAYTHLAPRPATPAAPAVSDRAYVEQQAVQLGMEPHPEPCRSPASPACTC